MKIEMGKGREADRHGALHGWRACSIHGRHGAEEPTYTDNG